MIDIAHWHYTKLGFKEWGLKKVAENFNLIIEDFIDSPEYLPESNLTNTSVIE